MKVKSFGCSFIYGSDLAPGERTWPAILANRAALDYECHAQPGIGNLQILESILAESTDDCVFLIGWTWIDRFGFVNTVDEQWHTLRPALDHPYADFYFRHLHSQYFDMLTNLIYVKSALDHLQVSRVPFLMTAMDYLMFEPVQPGWHDPRAVTGLQQIVQDHVISFEGFNFLDWSKQQGHAVSEAWHPVAAAHEDAADYLETIFLDLIA